MLELCQGSGCPRMEPMKCTGFLVLAVVVVILVLEQLSSEIRSQRPRC